MKWTIFFSCLMTCMLFGYLQLDAQENLSEPCDCLSDEDTKVLKSIKDAKKKVNINRFKIDVSNKALEAFISKFDRNDINRDGFELAGFMFVPIKEEIIETNENNESAKVFKTIGFRVALTLWNPETGDVKLHGFDCMDKIQVPVTDESSLSILQRELLKEYTLNLREASSQFDVISYEEYIPQFIEEAGIAAGIEYENGNIPPGPIILSKEEYIHLAEKDADTAVKREFELVQSTNEFEYVFLPYHIYSKLVTEYHPEPDSDNKGIFIERSISGVDIYEEDIFNGLKTHRSLSFRPNITPERDLFVKIDALAYAQGNHCPPFWIDIDRAQGLDKCDAVKEAVSVAMLETEIKIVEKVIYRNSPALSVHFGGLTSAPFDTLKLGFLLELDLEFRLKNDWAIELLYGIYNTAGNQRIFGHNVLLKKYFYSDNRPIIYAAAGSGMYNLQGNFEAGLTLGAGFHRNINDKIDLELGLQYQDLSLFTNRDISARIISGKIGFKFFINTRKRTAATIDRE